MKKITDKELKELLAVGDGEEIAILTMSGGSLYEEYEVIRPSRLQYNNVLKCHVDYIGDIEWYLHERFIAQSEGKSIFENKEVMRRAIQLIEKGFDE